MPRSAPHDFRNDSRGPRLQRVLADAGVASRRACEEMIISGRVQVNGQVVNQLPAWVDPMQDRIEVDHRPLPRKKKAGGHLYLMVNKPRHVICTNNDPEGRRQIIDLVPHAERLFCVGRLDAESSGLVLLTDDGDLAFRLTHPKFEISKTYRVSIAGSLSDEMARKLTEGLWLSDRSGGAKKTSAKNVQILQRDRERTRMIITLTEGRNREIRRMLARLGLKARRLERLALGPLKLRGVAVGDWRKLDRMELMALRRAAAQADKKTGKKRTGTKARAAGA